MLVSSTTYRPPKSDQWGRATSYARSVMDEGCNQTAAPSCGRFRGVPSYCLSCDRGTRDLRRAGRKQGARNWGATSTARKAFHAMRRCHSVASSAGMRPPRSEISTNRRQEETSSLRSCAS